MKEVAILLIGAVAGAILQAVQERRSNRREHAVWVREQQLTAVTAFINDVTGYLFETVNVQPEQMREKRFRLHRSAAIVQMVGDPRLNPSIQRLNNAVQEWQVTKPRVAPEALADIYRETLNDINLYFRFVPWHGWLSRKPTEPI